MISSVIGMIFHRHLLVKYFLCFETLFFIMSVYLSIISSSITGITILLWTLWNSTLEVMLVLSMLFYNTSYLFILFDPINKRSYFSSFTLVLNVCIFFRCSEYWLVLINLLIMISSIRSVSSIKHLLYISSYLLFIIVYLLILLNNYLFSYLYLLLYLLLNYMILIKCCTSFSSLVPNTCDLQTS